MKSRSRLRALGNQLKQFRIPVLIFLLFWIAGIITFLIIEEDKNFWFILLISICIKPSEILSDPYETFVTIYQFLWPLLFELIILTFILSSLQEFYGYNPIMSSRKLASHKSNHTVVLGCNHLGKRVVEYLRDNNQPYSVVEIDMDKVDDLINFHQPVVVGDYTDIDIMELAGVRKCKEVICVTSDLRRALIAAVKVRELNSECDLYMRVFDDHFREYLTSEPWNAYTFSLSKWTMNSIVKWSEKISKDNSIVVLGNDSIVIRMINYFGAHLESEVYLIDPEIDPEVFNDLPNVHPSDERVQFVENLEEQCDMNNVSQMYICWNTEELFSDAIILTVAVKKKYPHIELFVRMYDEELAEIAKTFDATTFSTSAFAFKMLQNKVRSNSGICPKTRDALNTRKYITKKKTVSKTVYRKKKNEH